MATLYNCGGRISTSITMYDDIVTYDIYRNSVSDSYKIASGQLIKTSSSTSVTFSFENIARNYLGSAGYDTNLRISFITPFAATSLVAGMINFIIILGNGTQYEVLVAYNYEKNIKEELPSFDLLNDPICSWIDVRMYMFFCAYSIDEKFGLILGAQENDDDIEFIDASSEIAASNSYINLGYKLDEVFIGFEESNDRVYLYHGAVETTSQNIKLSERMQLVNNCNNKFGLYYFNKKGGIDSLLLGKCVESWSAEKESVEVSYNGTSQTQQSRFNTSQKITKKLACNTLLMTEEQAAKIDNLIFSPSVYVHDLEEDEVYAAIISSSSVTKKYSKYDHALYYSFDLEYTNKSVRL